MRCKDMTEAELIHEGWFLWEAPAIYVGTQWSYEERQRPRLVNRLPTPAAWKTEDFDKLHEIKEKFGITDLRAR